MNTHKQTKRGGTTPTPHKHKHPCCVVLRVALRCVAVSNDRKGLRCFVTFCRPNRHVVMCNKRDPHAKGSSSHWGNPRLVHHLQLHHWIQLDKGLRFVNQTELFHPSSPPYPRIDFVPPIDSARVPPSLVCLEQISRSQPHPGHMLVKRHVRVRTLPTFVQQFVGFFAIVALVCGLPPVCNLAAKALDRVRSSSEG